MSKICNELVGKKCNFLKFGEIVVGSMPVYTILEVDAKEEVNGKVKTLKRVNVM